MPCDDDAAAPATSCRDFRPVGHPCRSPRTTMSTLLPRSRIRIVTHTTGPRQLERRLVIPGLRPYSTAPPPPDARPTERTPTPSLASSSRLAQSYPRLVRLSARTGVPLPSLGISFLILHELTAIIPVVLLFWLFQSIGLGVGLLSWIKGAAELDSPADGARAVDGGVEGGSGADPKQSGHAKGWKGLLRGWYDEAENKVERVGRRYGILGYEKRNSSASSSSATDPLLTGSSDQVHAVATASRTRSSTAAESVANAISAYVVVKVRL